MVDIFSDLHECCKESNRKRCSNNGYHFFIERQNLKVEKAMAMKKLVKTKGEQHEKKRHF